MFVTLVYGVLDMAESEIRYCNAGHNPPYVIRSGGRVEALPRAGGMGLCLSGEAEYGTGRVDIGRGDRLLLYSDGVTEAVSPGRDRFGTGRLEEVLSTTDGIAPPQVIETVLTTVSEFSQGLEQADDMTLLVLQYLGSSKDSAAG